MISVTLKYPDQIRFCKRVPLRGLFHVVRRRTGLEVKLAVEGKEVEVVMMRSARRWAWPLVSDVAEPVDTLIAAPGDRVCFWHICIKFGRIAGKIVDHPVHK